MAKLVLSIILSFVFLPHVGFAGSCSDIVSNGYVLENENYYCNSTLTVPEGVTLRSRSSIASQRGRILAGSGFNSTGPLVMLSRNSSLENVVVNGTWRATKLVQVRAGTVNSYESNPSGLDNDRYRMKIRNNLLINAFNGSRNLEIPAYVNGTRLDVAGIYIKAGGGSAGLIKRLLISGNEIKNIGFKSSGSGQGKRNPLDWEARADGIYMKGALEVHIVDNEISFTLSGGVHFGGCRNILVKENLIENIGLSKVYDVNARYVSDGITAYKNRAGEYGWIYSNEEPENFRILDNEIYNTGNNGIHVSGNNITIKRNTVLGQPHRGIYYGHVAVNSHGDPIGLDPMNNASIKQNTVSVGDSTTRSETDAIFVRRPSSTSNIQIKWNTIVP